MQNETMENRDSETWQEEIEQVAQLNAARILAMVVGITPGEAADRMLESETRGSVYEANGFRQMLTLGRVLNTDVHTTSFVSSYRVGFSSHPQFTDRYPNLAQWLDVNPNKIAILRAGAQFIYVGFGMKVAGSIPAGGRVTHCILLEE
ncbi:MAG: hypothetical protein V3T23_01685 [Nitrososphaerales archaeon]